MKKLTKEIIATLLFILIGTTAIILGYLSYFESIRYWKLLSIIRDVLIIIVLSAIMLSIPLKEKEEKK